MNSEPKEFPRWIPLSIVLIFLIASIFAYRSKNADIKSPNIVLFLIDDLGYGDIGCYGNKQVKTPHIDKLATEGMLFTDFHSNGPMCTPTRAALLTGMYQNRLGSMFERPLSGKTQYDKGLPIEAVTIAEVLKDAGYATGMFGKWHLGYQEPFLPTSQGFDTFVGLAAGDGDHHSHIDRWGRADWWQNEEKNPEEGYGVDLITQHSRQFIVDHKGQPFFLYIPHLAIHFPWQGPNDPPHRQEGKSYEDDKWGIIPDRKNVQPHVKAMIEAVDNGVGEIMNTLKELDLDENTLVIFTSDNGGYLHYNHEFQNISSNGVLRGQKTDMYEGGHRVPFIARWPGKILPGSKTDQIAMSMDLFPTFAELASVKLSSSQPLDGVSLKNLLFKNQPLPGRTLFWKMDDEFAIRKGPWKAIKKEHDGLELYNLKQDLGETNNLASTHPELTAEIVNNYNEWKSAMNQSAAKWK